MALPFLSHFLLPVGPLNNQGIEPHAGNIQEMPFFLLISINIFHNSHILWPDFPVPDNLYGFLV